MSLQACEACCSNDGEKNERERVGTTQEEEVNGREKREEGTDGNR